MQIQTIQAIASDVGHLTVLQRTPNWSAPLRNAKITPEERTQFIKEGRCFRCRELGHIAHNCPKNQGQSQDKRKFTPKQIKALIAELSEEEKKEMEDF